MPTTITKTRSKTKQSIQTRRKLNLLNLITKNQVKSTQRNSSKQQHQKANKSTQLIVQPTIP